LSLRFLGGDTGDGGSPRLYQDGDDFLVQGYTVTETRLLAELNVPSGESVVRVPPSLWDYLPVRQHGYQRPQGDRRGQWPVRLGRAADHREMRDLYAEEEDDAVWQAEMSDPAGSEACRRWLGLMSARAARLAAVREGRVMTGPDAGGARSGEAQVPPGIASAGQVRRLLRRGASALMMPVADMTVIDGTTRLVSHFSSDGTWVGSEMIDGSALARECASAFDAAWTLSAPHVRRG
jgi:uncharacterized protein DUF6879